MRIHNFTYLLKEGGRNIFSNKLMSFACIGVLVACFLLIGNALLLSLTINNVVEYVENQNEVVAYVENSATQDDIDALQYELQRLDNVSQVTFLTKDEVLEKEQQKAGDYAELYSSLKDDNPLPHTFVVQVRELGLLDETVTEINSLQGIDKVQAQTDVAKILADLKQVVNYAGFGVIIILIAVSVVIITNTIKLTVFSRRKEINIMKYVGATDSFIRLPFLVEGMLIGLMAALLAFFILGAGYTYLLHWAGENYADFLSIILTSAIPFRDVAGLMFGGFAFIGIFIGTIGSGVFVRKYLKV